MKSLPITLYGQFHGHWSNAGVSRGLAAGLHANGIGLKLVGERGLYENMWTLPRRVTRRPPDMQLCAGVPQTEGVGIFVGYAGRAAASLQGHSVRVGCFICESEILPPDWGVAARACDLVVVPSQWVRNAYVAAGVAPPQILVVSHGLHPVYRTALPPGHVDGARCLPDGLAFLHIAGARDFLERKGTPQLIGAFAKVFDSTNGQLRHQKALLVIRSPASPQLTEMVQATKASYLFHLDTHDEAMPPERMHAYLSNGWAAVVQPSRAEAFGIVPVEARAMGLPIILTHCSGHSAHVTEWDTVVAHGPAAPLAVNGIPNGMAPTVTVDAIADALRRFTLRANDHTAAARMNAGGYAAKYNWGELAAPLAKKLRELGRGGRTLAGRTVG